MPGRALLSATPSTFQKAVAPATLPPSSAGTALKPIVTRSTLPKSPPAPITIDLSTASSLGRPVTPTLRPSSSRGVLTSGAASTAASGRCTIDITATRSRPLAPASARSWMSITENCVRPDSSSFTASVELPGTRTVRWTPSASSKPRASAE